MAPDRRGPISSGALYDMVENARAEAHAAHRRLRSDTDELEQDFKKHLVDFEALKTRMTRMESTPIAAERVTFSWQVIGSMILGCAMVVAAFVTVRSSVVSLEQTVQQTAKQQDEKVDSTKKLLDAALSLQNERLDELKSSTDDLKKNMEMRRIEIQQLKDIVTANRR